MFGVPTRAALLGLNLVVFLGVPSAVHSGAENAFRTEKLSEIDKTILQAIADKKCPGGVLWFEHRGFNYHKTYGNRALLPEVETMTEDTIFDLASLTKVVACTPAIMLLIERKQVQLDEHVQKYLHEFNGDGREEITVRQLLTHTSGLRPDIETRSEWHGWSVAIEKACQEKPEGRPGSRFRYSDINFLLLGEIVRRVSGKTLDQFVSEEIFSPLGMSDTSYLPSEAKLPRIAPTEVVNGHPWRGVVHDPTARHMDGIAGHAGLFSTAADLARYARMLLNLGILDHTRIFTEETVKLMVSVQTTEAVGFRRGLGWDIDSKYSGLRGHWFPLGSYGHTGWTGTSLWIDPFSQTFVIFLSNRNHPTEAGSIGELRARLGTLAAEAIGDFNFAWVPEALQPRNDGDFSPGTSSAKNLSQPFAPTRVLNGIDVLAKQDFAPLRGKRLGLITNHTGENRNRQATIDLLRNAPDVHLVALFSPEHGIRGEEDAAVVNSTDPISGLPVYSLYGKSRKPNPEQLRGLDALVYDIQDVGCRFYTYPATMALCLEAAAEAGLEYFVLDRVNPINGRSIEGPVHTGASSFVAFHPVPVRYGMTIGEEAKMYNAEHHCNADLTVVPIEGWSRAMWFDETGLPWTNPSPNMRNLTEAILYPGIGLLESALSVGRGTDTPFEVVGAPYLDDVRLAEELNAAALPGVRFVPIQFTPSSSIHEHKLCRGVYIQLTDRNRCVVVEVGLLIAKTLTRLYPSQFDANKIMPLLLDPDSLGAIKQDLALEKIRAAWKPGLEEFLRRREKYLIYN